MIKLPVVIDLHGCTEKVYAPRRLFNEDYLCIHLTRLFRKGCEIVNKKDSLDSIVNW